jgi:hypothetical protein|tara:strand:- start:15381 stop:16082 length:702 start_codon:yes stop_codon:yes gene_type:complete
MNEVRRATYLDAIGVVSYVSRQQQPGAALTRRIEVVPDVPSVTPARAELRVKEPVKPSRAEDLTETKMAPQPQQPGETVPRFSLSAIVAGRWLWIEDLVGMPLATDQVQLVQSMARALLIAQAQNQAKDTAALLLPDLAKPDVEQFHWPIHNNRQFDLNATAARAGVAAFVNRRLEQHGCAGLILLGKVSTTWIPAQELSIPTVCTAASAEILASPSCKPVVWRELLPLANRD